MESSSCRCCGTCCRKGGPILHQQDLGMLDVLGLASFVCLRTGEPAYDPRQGGVRPLEQELIKIQGKDKGWECRYFDAATSRCSIYESRPAQCRALVCTNVRAVLKVMDSPTLTRTDYIRRGSALWECVQEHDRLYPVAAAVKLARQAVEAATIPPQLDQQLRAETAYRRAMARHVRAMDQDLWAYLGRPLWLVLMPYGAMFSHYRDAE